MVKTEMVNLFSKQSYWQNTYKFCPLGELEYIRMNQWYCTTQWCIDTNLKVDPYQYGHGLCNGNAQTQHKLMFDLQTRCTFNLLWPWCGLSTVKIDGLKFCWYWYHCSGNHQVWGKSGLRFFCDFQTQLSPQNPSVIISVFYCTQPHMLMIWFAGVRWKRL